MGPLKSNGHFSWYIFYFKKNLKDDLFVNIKKIVFDFGGKVREITSLIVLIRITEEK